MSDSKVTKENLQEFATRFHEKNKSLYFKEADVPEVIPPIVSEWLTENVDPDGAAGVVDKTLSIEGTAADAKATGDEISSLKGALDDIYDFTISTDNLLTLYKRSRINGKYYNQSEGLGDYYYFRFIPVTADTVYYCATARFVAFFDSNKEYVSTLQSQSIFTPAQNGYVHITFSNSITDPYLCTQSDYEQGTVAPYNEYYLSPSISSDIEAEKTDNIKNYMVNWTSENLADKTNFSEGYLDGNGNLVSNTGFTTTDFIPITENSFYTIGPTVRMYALYNAHKKNTIRVNLQSSTSITIQAPFNGFIRITRDTGNADIMVAEGQIEKSYSTFKKYFKDNVFLNNEQIEDIKTRLPINEYNGNILYGKKWVACGDSFTHGDFTNAPEDNYHITDGIYTGEYKVYPYLIGNRNNMTIVNEAVNGSTMTHIDGRTNAFSDTRYTQIPSDADYITLKFGINDDSSHQNVPMGNFNSNDNTTFYGAYMGVLNYLIHNHPQAKIGIIVTNGATREIADATIAIAERYGIPYLNEATLENMSYMFRSNRTKPLQSIITFRNESWYVSNIEGSLNYHPNAEAHEYESTVIEAWLRTL